MKMNKLSKVCAIFLLATTVSAVNANPTYIPSQLEQFEKTGICIGCDLSEANLNSHNNANLTNALLVKANITRSTFYTSNFSGAQMMYANLYNLKASGSNFNSTNLTGANLSSANLSSCDFSGAILSQADLSNADLARANISVHQLASAKSLSCAIMPDGTRHLSDTGSRC
jgi:uncharacterized protein YjbI with pentapeptide repeats